MKIQWLTVDFRGGSILTDKELIAYGEEVFNYKISVRSDYASGFDLTVISNIHGKEWIIPKLRMPFIKIEHDYGFCTYYDALCEYHNCSTCTHKLLWQNFNKRSKLNFYMSPRQFEVHNDRIGPIPNVRFIQSQINLDVLCSIQKLESVDYVVAPVALRHHKGIDNLIKWAKENKKKIKVFGRMEDGQLKDKLCSQTDIEYKGLLPHKKVLEEILAAGEIVFLPTWIEPTGRGVMEAILLGCEVHYNSNLGLSSWLTEFDPEDLKLQMYVSKFNFWQNINKVMEV
jgi:glycosyltransferase involved in cell wall biosynthesis